jgi:tetratricopeptide (TPR) repeat protein
MTPDLQEALAAADRRQVDGDPAGAVALYDAVLAADPSVWTAHANRGLALAVCGRDAAARAGFRRAISIAPDAAPALRNLVDSLLLDATTDASLPTMANALRALLPGAAEAWLAVGRVELRLDHAAPGLRALRRAITLAPAEGEALAAYGQALPTEGGVCWLGRLAAAMPTAETLAAHGRAEAALGRNGTARRALRRAIALDPGRDVALVEFTSVLDASADALDLVRWGRRAIARVPASAAAWNNLGTAELSFGRLEQAERSFAAATALRPGFAEPHFNRATPLFLAGRSEEAWAEYEWRARIERFERPPSAAPRWAGDPLRGRTLLVHDEQGIGDSLQFIRYLPLVDADGGRVVLACDPRLVRLFQAALPGVSVSARPSLPPHDVAVPLPSLPYLLGATKGHGTCPYLVAPDPVSIAAGGRLRVGLVWSGNPAHVRDRERSIPLSLLGDLVARRDIAWISLQVGPGREDIARLGLTERIADLGAGVSDMLDTARIVAGLDLVLAVDTSTAHLAGALGRPVWTMISWLPDWRWGMRGAATPWYPSMRLFRQPQPGDWRATVAAVAEALDEQSSLR